MTKGKRVNISEVLGKPIIIVKVTGGERIVTDAPAIYDLATKFEHLIEPLKPFTVEIVKDEGWGYTFAFSEDNKG